MFGDERAPLRCSTSEPRLLLAGDHAALVRARADEPDFFRVFVANATRAWTPLWCIERGQRLDGIPDVRAWFDAPVEASR